MASVGVLILVAGRRCLGKEQRKAAVTRGRCWASMVKEKRRVLGEDDTAYQPMRSAGSPAVQLAWNDFGKWGSWSC